MVRLGTAPPRCCQRVTGADLTRVAVAELKKGIYHVFSQFGEILDVQLKKTYKMRGQAWVVFSDVGGSSRALREMQGFVFFGKPMVRRAGCERAREPVARGGGLAARSVTRLH
jgi:hypothetical protein